MQRVAAAALYLGFLMPLGFLACSDQGDGVLSDASAPGVDSSSPDLATDPGVLPEVLSFCDEAGEGGPCDDGDACTVEDHCQSGLCIGASTKICDEEGPCRIGVCQEEGACEYSDAEDGALCSVACFQQATCEVGECKAVPGSQQPCETPDNPCVDELKCDPSTNLCTIEIYAFEGESCDTDEDVCTIEICDAVGECLDSNIVNTCEAEAGSNPCWTYVCSAKKGCLQTQFVAGVSCNDGNACTLNDSCTKTDLGLKVCQGSPLPIDDGNPCTNDTCVEGVVEHAPLNGTVCPIEHPCTDLGLCEEALCVPQQECECYVDSDCGNAIDPCLGPMICDTTGELPQCVQDLDSPVVCPPNPELCYDNICVSGTGECTAKAALDGTSCDDSDACTAGEACFGGVCGNGEISACDDSNVCNGVEVCNAQLGCVAGTPLVCDDQDACTGTETCHVLNGCIPGVPLLCGDGTVCNGVESCDPAAGCLPGTPLGCDDQIFCNGTETCHPIDGCELGQPPSQDDGIACTVDACNEATNTVTHTPIDALCGEGNPCTAGSCDQALGCQLSDVPNGTLCPGGTCSNGSCTCQPSCPANYCGDDGCGGSCGCADGLACVGDACVVVGDDGWPGLWVITANPPTQSLGGLGIASFLPVDLHVEVVGGAATAWALAPDGGTVNYSGTATDIELDLNGFYLDNAGISHDEHWHLILDAPGLASGTMDEALLVLNFPFNLSWTIEAVKQ